MKGKILHILRASGNKVISGEGISETIGVSRVSVWKHVKKLQEIGYAIESTPKGYILDDRGDFLYPWEFPGRRERIHFFPEAPSTMEIARNLAMEGCPEFTVVVAGRQKNGRGRLGRKWISDKGGLYFTVVLRPEIPPAFSSRVNFAASLSLSRVLENRFQVNARVKWPNDLLINERKLCGMLSEMEAEADRVKYLNIGIGVNVNNDPSVEPNATSVKRVLGREISRRDLLSAFLDDFEALMVKGDFAGIIDHWKERTVTIGRRVRIVTTRGEYEGKAMDVDENGSLLLEMDDGSVKTVIYGDCFHQPGSFPEQEKRERGK